MDSIEKVEFSPVKLQSSRRLTVAHLNNDCLEKVFSYLNLIDLTNVAESNVHLAISAQSLFAHKYKTKEFTFNCHDKYTMSDDIFLLILQHFGKCLVKLRVQFSVDNKERNCLIFDAIVENCRATLSELTLLNVNKEIKLNKQFLALKKLRIWESLFGIHSSITLINHWFPNLSSIQLCNIPKFWENSLIMKNFPKLETFSFLTFPLSDGHTKNTLSKLAHFLHINPQLKSLELDELDQFGDDDLRETFNRLAPNQLPNIERLKVVSPYPFPHGTFTFDNLKEFKLSIFRDTSDIFNQLPRSIECFELRMNTVSVSAFNYILSCPKLKKLKLIASSFENSSLEEIAKELQSLTEIHIKFCQYMELINSVKLAGLEYFFLESKQIKKITLEYELNSFDEKISNYKTQVEFARKFTKMMDKTTQTKWRLSHEAHMNQDDHRTHELSTFPYLLLSFKKLNTY